MKTSLAVFTTALLLFLFASSIMSQSTPVAWLVDSSNFSNGIRIFLILLLTLILLYRPPRPQWFRYSLGAVAAVLSGIAVFYLLSYRINLIDVLLYLETSIVLMIEALEVKKIRLPRSSSPTHKVPVRFS